MCVCLLVGSRDQHCVANLSSFSPYLWKESPSLHPELTSLARLAGPWTPGKPPLSVAHCWECRHVPQDSLPWWSLSPPGLWNQISAFSLKSFSVRVLSHSNKKKPIQRALSWSTSQSWGKPCSDASNAGGVGVNEVLHWSGCNCLKQTQ